jgi:hypothetical protein
LVRLIEPRVELHEAAVTQRKDAHDKKGVWAPAEERLGPCGKKPLPLNSEIHGRLLWLAGLAGKG